MTDGGPSTRGGTPRSLGRRGSARRLPVCGYLRVRPSAVCPPGTALTLGDCADVRAPGRVADRVRAQPLGRVPGAGEHRLVPLLDLLAAAQRAAPRLDWRVIGQSDAFVQGAARRRPRWALGVAVWVLLFIGAGTTLLNFHADVNMPAAHRELYRLATGRQSARPLAVEIPYAVGVGLGALIFFIAPGGGGREPGPLELEAADYESRLRAYWRTHRRARR